MATNIDFILKNGLQVGSNVTVGSYTGTYAAPVNGMIVSGSVGVGSSSPSTKFAVSGNISLWNTETLSGIQFADGTWQYSAASNAAVGVHGSIQFNDGNGAFDYNANLIWDESNQRLGIGTSAPAASIHVEGNTPALFGTLNGASNPEINVGNATVGSALGWNTDHGYASIIGGAEVLSWNGTGVGIKGVTAVNALDVAGGAVFGGGIEYAGVGTAPSNGILVQGSVGIGTVSPSAKLEVQAGGNQAGLRIRTAAVNASDFLRFIDSSDAAMFTVNSSGNVTVGGWNGSVINANYGGTGQSSYSAGDILYATSSASTLSKLSIGSTGNILVVSGGNPSWGTLDLASSNAVGTSILGLSNGGTNAALTASNGGIVWSNASQLQILSASATSGNVLISGGAGTPSWGQSYTSANVADTIVSRGGSGEIAVGAVTAGGALNVTTGGANITGGLMATGTATVNALVSNGAISGTTISGTDAYLSTVQTSGTATVNALVSNGAISGTTISGTDAYLSTVHATGTATVNALVSNGAVSGTTGTFTGAIVGNSVTSETTLLVGGTATVNSLTSNLAVTVSSGGINVTGPSQFTGNMSVTGNLNVSGNINTVNSNVLVVKDPIIYVGEDNPGNNWDLGIIGSYTTDIYRHTGLLRNKTDGVWTIFDNLIVEPTDTIDWNQAGLNYGSMKIGNVSIASGLASSNYSTGALVITGSGGIGVGGSINVQGQITSQSGGLNIANLAVVNSLVVNTSIDTSTLVSSGAAIVNSLTSNGAISGTTINGTDITATGTITANAFVSNTALSASSLTVGNLNVTTSAVVNTLTSNGAISGTTISGTDAYLSSVQTTGTATVNALVSNGAVSGTSATFSSVNSTGTATVNALVSNGAISGTTVTGTDAYLSSVQTTGTATVNALVSNGAISGTTATVTSLNSTGTATVNALVSNGAISGTTISGTDAYLSSVQSSGTATVNALVSNGAISGTTVTGTDAYLSSVQTTGTATVNALVSNGAISGTTVSGTNAYLSTVQTSGTATVNALVSNGSVSGTTAQFSSTATVNSLVSNGAISGTTISGTDAYLSSVQSSGTATVNALVSNGAVSGTSATFSSVQSSGTATVNALVSNGAVSGTTAQFSSTATVNSLVSNGAISGTTATVTSLTATGTVMGNALVSNTSVTGNTWVIDGSVASTSGTSAITVDTWPIADLRTVHYIAQVTDNTNAGEFQATQFMIIHDGSTAFKSEYNMMWTVANLGNFDASVSGSNVVVTFQASAPTNKTIKLVRTGVEV